MALRIGIDFDNTISGYDDVFSRAARDEGLVPADFIGTKQQVREAVRRLDDGELKWQRLQGLVYGMRMAEAVMFDGVGSFLRRCRARGDVSVFVVSHKTEHGHFDPARINLREAALQWMASQGFFADEGFAIPAGNVYFESSREEKIARIAALKCTHFIDDLEEVLDHMAFPPGVEGILFANGAPSRAGSAYRICAHWRNIEEVVFAGDR